MGKRPRLRDLFAGHKETPSPCLRRGERRGRQGTPPYTTEDLMEMALEGETDEDRVEKALKKLHKAHQRLKHDIEDGKV